ncbi:hypothetical protein [Halovivax sp.]|nr:hypothetical protein [Halovivax sp.]
MFGGLPTGAAVAVLAMVLLPILTFALYLIDRRLNDGYVSILGRA